MKEVKSIHELAKETGVSSSTVSKVLNGNGRISAETRRRVLAATDKFNFKPRLKARRSTIAFVVNTGGLQLHDAYHTNLSSALARELAAREACVEFYSWDNLSKMRRALIDGVLCMEVGGDVENALRALPAPLPKVFVNTYGPEGSSLVISDHVQSGRLPAEYFLKHGHRLAGFIISSMRAPANAEKVRSFQDCFAEKGIDLPSRLICDVGELSLLEAVERILKEGATALYLATTGRTAEFAAILRRLKLRVPDDLSVIAMEENGATGFQDPPYTAVKMEYDELAAKSVGLLLRLMDAPGAAPERIVIGNQFIERDSVAAPRGAGK